MNHGLKRPPAGTGHGDVVHEDGAEARAHPERPELGVADRASFSVND